MSIDYIERITWGATAKVMVRECERPGPRTQKDIDRIPDGHTPMYNNQLAGKIATGQLPRRSVWQRLKARFQ